MTNKYLVVMGLDPDKKARAARFDLVDAVAVRKVASERGLKVGTPKSREVELLAAKLPDGKIYLSGKGLVPFVRADIFAKLENGLAFEQLAVSAQGALIAQKPAGALESPANGANGSPGQKAEPAKPGMAEKGAASPAGDPWAAIQVGSVVLVQDKEAPPNRAWWEATITAVAKDGTLTARWSSFPALKPFQVRRSAVALIPTKH